MAFFAHSRLLVARTHTAQHTLRQFTTTPCSLAKSLPPRPILLDSDLIEKFLHGSGPGGQKINKTSSAVQLKHIPTGIVVKYQDTRSRTVNRKMARKILQEKIEEMELGEDARTKIKQREKSSKKRSAEKKRRRKYRKLEQGEGEEKEEDLDEVVDGTEVPMGMLEHGMEAQVVMKRDAASPQAASKPEGG